MTEPPLLDLPYRVLGREVRIRCSDPLLAERIPDVAVAPDEDLPAGEPIEIDLLRGEEFFEVHHGGRLCFQHFERDAVIVELEALATFLAAESMEDRLRLHAGCADLDGHRALFAGDKGSGKTTFLLRLLLAGHDVLCDENVMVKKGHVIPVPRKFHLRDDSFPLLPGLVGAKERLRSYTYQGIGTFRFLDPGDLGRGWKAGEGPAAAVFFIEPNFGGPSSVEPMAKIDMVRHLLFQTVNLGEKPGGHIAELTAFVGDIGAWRLRLGDLDGAVEGVRTALSGTNSP